MTPLQSEILKKVLAERKAQDEQWGGPQHDDLHSAHDWAHFINKQTRGCFRTHISGTSIPEYPERIYFKLIKIAAVAFAGLESIERMTPVLKRIAIQAGKIVVDPIQTQTPAGGAGKNATQPTQPHEPGWWWVTLEDSPPCTGIAEVYRRANGTLAITMTSGGSIFLANMSLDYSGITFHHPVTAPGAPGAPAPIPAPPAGESTSKAPRSPKTPKGGWLVWEVWKAQLLTKAKELDWDFDPIEACGEEYWRTYYDDAYTPEEALLEDASNA